MTARILVVEDNPATRRLAKLVLEGAGFEVFEAADGRTAVEQFERGAPDLVLQDLLLPDCDGLDLVKRLRALPRGPATPILAFTAVLSEEQKRDIATSFDDFIPKNMEPGRLLNQVRLHLPPSALGEERPGQGWRVLVADADSLQRNLLRLRLEQLGFEVMTATGGSEALRLLHERRVDAVLSDCMMPHLDGFRLAAAIRADPALRLLPVILLTSGYVESEDEALARSAGATALVVRSPDFAVAIEALLRSLRTPAEAPAPAAPGALTDEYAQTQARRVERLAASNGMLAQRVSVLAAELAVLSGIAEFLVVQQDPGQLLEGVLERCLDAAGVSRGALFLLEGAGALALRAQAGYSEADLRSLEMGFGHAEALRALVERGLAVGIPSPALPDEAAAAVLAGSRAASGVFIPIRAGSGPVGGILMASQRQRLHAEEWLDFARTVALQIGQAITLSRAFQRLSASEARFRRLLELLPEAVLVYRAGRIAFVNDAAVRLFGARGPEDLVGRSALERLHPDERADVEARVRQMLETRRPLPFVERRMLRLDGSVIDSETAASPFQDDDGDAIHVVIRDLSERRRTERELQRQREQLVQSEKLAAMTGLLAGVAHELNNPLSVVIGQAGLLRRAVGEGPVAERSDKITKAAERCVRIVKNFLALAREQAPERSLVSLNEVLEDALELLVYPLHVEGVELVRELAPALPVMWADPHQLHQVVVNLVSNAQHAMRGSALRRLTLRTRSTADGRVVLEVADTGRGIPPEERERVFEPFFTTKPQGEGTGLGLPLCLGIVEAHGGRLSVESEPGQGATFRVELPAEVPKLPAYEAALQDAAPPAAGCRLLVVDDEPEMRDVLAELLALDGHRVELASSGEEALGKLAAGAFDAVLSDVKMPDMDGPALYAAVERTRPELRRRFLFITGDTFSAATQAFLERAGVPTLSKPFDYAALQRALAGLLAEER